MNLNDNNLIAKLDASNVRGSIKDLPLQISQTWKEVSEMNLPESYQKAKHIILAGMGGSSLGGHVVKHVYKDTLSVTCEVASDYTLPTYVSSDSLIIVESYSGNTEESLSCYEEARRIGAHIVTISSGGKLEILAQDHQTPHYSIKPDHNPSNQPRMAVGYSIFALVAILHRLHFIQVSDAELHEIESLLHKNNEICGIENTTYDNWLRSMTINNLHENIIVLVSAEHLTGAIHTVRNQINENAKQTAFYLTIPDMDHHILESLSFPSELQKRFVYLFINSPLFHGRNTKRIELTRKVVSEAGCSTLLMSAKASGKLAQAMEIIHQGSYIGFYLAMMNNIDPAPIPQVEAFKKLLA